ncbi:hypothetical protein [Anaerophaga thermohalophila]|jgi:hypothetical protein|uniref:hypothetical protein n=1 Tax=Anaerophaga thermohalophila TaxID=177400 RepID=UPI0003188EBA|nr:hypothetical protein [Anaerophaga thermohalophila]
MNQIQQIKIWDNKMLKTLHRVTLTPEMYRNINAAAEAIVAVKTMIRMSAAAAVSAIASKRFLSLGF